MTPVLPVILCGGSGSRLWPLSRAGFPKQFLCLTGAESLFQQAARRLQALARDGFTLLPMSIVTNEAHRFLTQEQLREIAVPLGAALLEPDGRNTAAALTLAAFAAQENGADPVLVVTPADQNIQHTAVFVAAMHCAIDAAADGAIVTLGIVPNRPETGYGYIRVRANQNAASAAQRVAQFVEKPNAQTAQAYLDAGDYFWNAGMFVVRASVWLQAIQQFREDILLATQRAWSGRRIDSQFVRPDAEAFAAIPSESIDYAVMEHAPAAGLEVKMVALDAGWSDLGAWDAVWDVLPKDAAGNAQFGDVMLSNTRNTMVHASDRLVAVVGTDDLVVIETADAVLVASQRNSQEVKHIVQALEAAAREEHALHRKVHRPWGWYDSIDVGERFKVKRIQVKPGASLSLQKHQHRAEHWVVVRGEAEITCGERTERLLENQSTYIPQGAVHRLANPGKIPLEIIEVQSGAYLGEDDIERLADDYGRGTK